MIQLLKKPANAYLTSTVRSSEDVEKANDVALTEQRAPQLAHASNGKANSSRVKICFIVFTGFIFLALCAELVHTIDFIRRTAKESKLLSIYDDPATKAKELNGTARLQHEANFDSIFNTDNHKMISLNNSTRQSQFGALNYYKDYNFIEACERLSLYIDVVQNGNSFYDYTGVATLIDRSTSNKTAYEIYKDYAELSQSEFYEELQHQQPIHRSESIGDMLFRDPKLTNKDANEFTSFVTHLMINFSPFNEEHVSVEEFRGSYQESDFLQALLFDYIQHSYGKPYMGTGTQWIVMDLSLIGVRAALYIWSITMSFYMLLKKDTTKNMEIFFPTTGWVLFLAILISCFIPGATIRSHEIFKLKYFLENSFLHQESYIGKLEILLSLNNWHLIHAVIGIVVLSLLCLFYLLTEFEKLD